MSSANPHFDQQYLIDTFQKISRDMQDLPIFNPALSPYTPGFIEYDGYWTGVLVTPWFMNLMAFPVEQHADAQKTNDDNQLVFPNGVFECTQAQHDDLGSYLSCSLLSPVFEFSTQDEAMSAARAAMGEIFIPPPQKPVSRRDLLQGFRAQREAHE